MCLKKKNLIFVAVIFPQGRDQDSGSYQGIKSFQSSLKGVLVKNERGYRLNAIKGAFDRY